MEFLNDRRNFYNEHVQDLEIAHKSKMAQLENDFQEQKLQLDKNLQALEESQKTELVQKLEADTVEYHSVLKQSQSVLIENIVKVVKRHLTRTVFESGQQRAELAKDELEPLLKNYFNQSTKIDSKPWHQWRPWMYATCTSLVVMTGLIAKIIFF